MQSHHQPLVFDVVVHAAPQADATVQQVSFEQGLLETLAVTEAELPPFSLSFEQALEQLESLPSMFVEPDGSFVWKTVDAGIECQLDGNLYDRGNRLLYSTLKGTCTMNALDQWLTSIGWPAQAVVMQDLRQGWFLTERAFRKFAGR